MPDLCKTQLIDYEINDDLNLKTRSSVSNRGFPAKKALEVQTLWCKVDVSQ